MRTSQLSVADPWWGVEGSMLILGVILLAALGTAVLFLISLAAYLQRRTLQYGLITVAIGLLLLRSVVGAGTALGRVPMPVHHLVEHGLDFAIAGLLLFAIYISYSSTDSDPEQL